MDILKKCQRWHENGEYDKIIDALEKLPQNERTPETDSELARAYNNRADPDEPEGRAMLKRAIALLKPHEKYFDGDHSYNFRMGYAYYFLDREEIALHYFENALKACPDDEDTKVLIESCYQNLSMPDFAEDFRQRTQMAWEVFFERESELRRIIEEDKKHERGTELLAKCSEIFETAFDKIAIEMGFSGEKPEIILTPQGDKVKLFELVYFKQHAPAEVLTRWNIQIGRQPSPEMSLRIAGCDISGSDVRVWIDRQEDDIELTLFCEKLVAALKEDKERVWLMLNILIDHILGEIPVMRYITDFDVANAPLDKPSILLSELPKAMIDMGLDLSTDAEALLEIFTAYQMEPDKDPDAAPRSDIIAGSTCCPSLINDYLDGESYGVDCLYADGSAAGFIQFPLDSFTGKGKKRSQKIFNFRDELTQALEKNAGSDAFTFLGGATGTYRGYLDFIAWDLPAVLDAAEEFFESKGVEGACFHAFRKDAFEMPLSEQDEEEGTGVFTGFVLLSKAEWDKEKLFSDLKEKWDIVPDQTLDEMLEEGDEEVKDNLIFTYNDMTAVIGLIHAPIPDGEAETYAENNYLWRDAVKVAKAHKAHILVAVLSEDADVLECAKLYTKLLAACCSQKRTTGIYTSDVVFEPRFYEMAADVMKEDNDILPMINLVWVGLYQSEGGLCGYTCGLDVFGKDEIEVLDANASPDEMRGFIFSLAEFVLECNVEFHDGETVGFSVDDKHAITRSEGVALPGMTLKISYSPLEE